MSENDKDNKDFEFISEQVIEKKRKKYKKWIVPLILTAFMAILFGVIAALTFCIAEPEFYLLLHKQEENKTPVSFPTEYPNDPNNNVNTDNTGEKTEGGNNSTSGQAEETEQIPETVIIENTIDADLKDYISMYDDINTLVFETNKSLVNVSSIIDDRDWFGSPIEKKIESTGIVIYNDNENLLILVSLDRVKDANSIQVVFSDKNTINAVIQDYEKDINLAVIAVSLEDIPETVMKSIAIATLGESYSITVGSPIIALGNPNGHLKSMETGIITSKGSYASITDNKLDLFNTDIKDNKYSDGVIINLKGEVIGLITRTLKEDINQDISTIIGISKIRPIIERMGNKEPRIYFGVKTIDMTDAAKIEHEVQNGIFVDEVQSDSPAFSSGIKNGDIIMQVNDQTVINSNNFYNIISSYQSGDEILVKIKRTSTTQEKEMSLNIVLVDKEQ